MEFPQDSSRVNHNNSDTPTFNPSIDNNNNNNTTANQNRPRMDSCMSDFDFQECDAFIKSSTINTPQLNPENGNNNNQNHHHQHNNQLINHQFYLPQNAFFQEAPGNSNVFLPPRKYEYLGQKEEQIYQESKSAVMSIPDFDFLPYNNNNNHIQRGFQSMQVHSSHQIGSHNPVNTNTLPHSSSNNNNNNLLFSAFRKNSEVDITDLFPPAELVPKTEHQQYYEESDFAGNENAQPRESSSHFSSSSPIIPKNEPNPINDHHLFYQQQQQLTQPYPFSLQNSQRPLFAQQQQQQQLQPQQLQQQQQYPMPYNYAAHQLFQQQQQHLIAQQFQHQQLFQPFHLNNSSSNNNHSSYFNIQPKRVNVFSIVRDQPNDRKKDYDKNICRYITRQVVRSFASPDFKNKVLTIIADIYPDAPSNNILSLYKDVTEYFLGEIENLSGFRALKEVLLINVEADGKVLATQKRIFRSFMKWFLKERYFRNILNGNMNDKLAFIKYKNKIMLHYINKPHKWNSNKKKAAEGTKDISMLSKLECL